MSVGGEGGREASGYMRRKLAMFILYVEMYSITVARVGGSQKIFIVYLHVLKASASNGSKKKVVPFWPKVVVGPRYLILGMMVPHRVLKVSL